MNELKSLKHLELINFFFTELFILKLKNLNSLFLIKIHNISFNEDIFLNLKRLEINDCELIISEELLNLSKVEYFDRNFWFFKFRKSKSNER